MTVSGEKSFRWGMEREFEITVNGEREFDINNNKKSEENDYLNKINNKIDKLMWVFCKNGCVK